MKVSMVLLRSGRGMFRVKGLTVTDNHPDMRHSTPPVNGSERLPT